MKISTKKKLMTTRLIAQISIYAFIIIHSIAWHIFGIHYISKLCPGKFALHIGNLEFNYNVLFWVLIFISTLFVGRAFCGWGCMFGAYQDFISRIFTKLGFKGIKGKSGVWLMGILIIISGLPFFFEGTPPWPIMFWFLIIVFTVGIGLWLLVESKSSDRKIKSVTKYILLAQYLGGIVATWILLNVFQKGISFAFDKYGVLDDYKTTIGITFIFLSFGLTALGVAIEKRFFCKYVCPYGLLLRILSYIPFSKRYKIKSSDQCVNCSQCNKTCPMGIDAMGEIKKYGMIKSPECINCLQCVAVCPKSILDYKQ